MESIIKEQIFYSADEPQLVSKMRNFYGKDFKIDEPCYCHAVYFSFSLLPIFYDKTVFLYLQMNKKRRDIAIKYSKEIKNAAVVTPKNIAENYVAHLYVVKSKQRNLLKEYLKSNQIASDIHYPIPDHRQPFFENQFKDLTLKNTEELSDIIITLPCYPEMPEKDVEKVISAVNEWNP